MTKKQIDEIADFGNTFILSTGEPTETETLMVEVTEAQSMLTIHFTGNNTEYSVTGVPCSELERFSEWLRRMARRLNT